MTALQTHLILHRFVCHEFGCEDVGAKRFCLAFNRMDGLIIFPFDFIICMILRLAKNYA